LLRTSTEGLMREAEHDDRQRRAEAHFAAARRLGDGMREHPGMRGLARAWRFHVARAATLATELCGR
jgi:hypothetical protein